MNDPKEQLLIIFTRNIVLGKCKTRLAKTVGPQLALDIYKFLVEHTVKISSDVNVTRWVFYSDEIEENDLFDPGEYSKHVQQGNDLGSRMFHAISAGFEAGFSRVIIIGSDIYDLESRDLEEAFDSLNTHDYVIGPAQDGGYYLLGMKKASRDIFVDKSWGTNSVLQDTLEDLEGKDVKLLDTRNDVDVYEDIETAPAFQRFLKNVNE